MHDGFLDLLSTFEGKKIVTDFLHVIFCANINLDKKESKTIRIQLLFLKISFPSRKPQGQLELRSRTLTLFRIKTQSSPSLQLNLGYQIWGNGRVPFVCYFERSTSMFRNHSSLFKTFGISHQRQVLWPCFLFTHPPSPGGELNRFN